LTTDEAAVHADLPDLVLFMLGTGVRIGESLAVLWSQVNLETGAVEITHTMARVPGHGLIRKAPKSKAGERALPLPDWAVAMLRRRHAAGVHLDQPIFADSLGGFRDPSNVRRALRRALSPVGSAARHDLGQVLRSARLQAGLTRKQVVKKLSWPKTRLELIENGRIKIDRALVATLVKAYGIDLDRSPSLSAQVDRPAEPSPSDALTWIRSHTFRKTTAPPWTAEANPPAK
jgi:transcriptional regulator with XRE-family HTH domain